MQDVEFTVEDGRLYFLQTRSAKRTAAAALKVARDLVDEGLISRDEAVAPIDPGPLDQLLPPMIEARGVLTAHGGMTSHAAVVARGMGKPCVAGCEELSLDPEERTARIGEHDLREGDVITIDGGPGRVIVGEVPLVPPQ